MIVAHESHSPLSTVSVQVSHPSHPVISSAAASMLAWVALQFARV